MDTYEAGTEYELFNHENPEGLRAMYSGVQENGHYLFYTSEDGDEIRIHMDSITQSQEMSEENHDLWYIEEVSENAYMSNTNRRMIQTMPIVTPNRVKKRKTKSRKSRKSRNTRKSTKRKNRK
jgi:hypothetical protein